MNWNRKFQKFLSEATLKQKAQNLWRSHKPKFDKKSGKQIKSGDYITNLSFKPYCVIYQNYGPDEQEILKPIVEKELTTPFSVDIFNSTLVGMNRYNPSCKPYQILWAAVIEVHKNHIATLAEEARQYKEEYENESPVVSASEYDMMLPQYIVDFIVDFSNENNMEAEFVVGAIVEKFLSLGLK